jgi:hypothetical protein
MPRCALDEQPNLQRGFRKLNGVRGTLDDWGHPTFGLFLLLLDGRRRHRQLGKAAGEPLTNSWMKSG